ncbi:MAG: GEVED domain-containing protein [Bacteroidales bacterium]
MTGARIVDFNDSEVKHSMGDQTNSGTVNGNIVVPVRALLGSTRMRVTEQYSQDPGTAIPPNGLVKPVPR